MALFVSQSKNEKPAPIMPTEEIPTKTFQEPPKPPRVNTIIAKEVVVAGALRGDGIVQIDGTIEGQVEITGSIIISSTGVVKGPIAADVVRIVGRVEGNVNARSRLRLEKQGTLIGDVITGSLVVEDGGCLNGHCEVIRPSKEDPPPPAPEQPDDLQFGANYKMDEEEPAV